MSEQQLSFLSSELSSFDVNAVDEGVINESSPIMGSAASALSKRSVDDWVFGLGFTNWKAVIDHALRTGHFELYRSEEGNLGLRKHGYRYAPIPRLPSGGATYIQQRLLSIASERNAAPSRQERMFSPAPDFSHKFVVEHGVCDVTIKQSGTVLRASIEVEHLNLSDLNNDDASHLAVQLESVLASAGAQAGPQLTQGCKSLATQVLRVIQGVV